MTSARERDGHERLFGWRYAEQDTEMGLYVTARVAAGPVGGMMHQPPDQAAAGIPPSWTAFIGAARLDTVVASITEGPANPLEEHSARVAGRRPKGPGGAAGPDAS